MKNPYRNITYNTTIIQYWKDFRASEALKAFYTAKFKRREITQMFEEVLDNLINAWEQLKETIIQAIEPIINTIKEAVNIFWDKIRELFCYESAIPASSINSYDYWNDIEIVIKKDTIDDGCYEGSYESNSKY